MFFVILCKISGQLARYEPQYIVYHSNMSFSCLNIVVSCSMMIQIISLVTKIFVIMFNLYIEPDKMSEICYSVALSKLS